MVDMAPQDSGATDREIEALMRLVHVIEAEHRARPTSSLDLRARMLIQELGLHGESPILAVRRSLRLSPSTLTSLADRLERDGYLERRRHPTDRRTVVLVLTAAGRRAYAAEKEFYRHLIDDSLQSLDAMARSHVLAALAGIAPGQEGGPASAAFTSA
jgi:DNA-binding MarR family transcriptional regulator